jgi:hypothetical protein
MAAGLSADDMLDDDELDLAQVGELLGDELPATPARPIAPVVDETDEFADLLQAEEELPATPASVVASSSDSTSMLDDLDTLPTELPSDDDDEFAGLDVPNAPAVASVPTADAVPDLDELDSVPPAAEVATATDTVAAEATDLDELDELNDLDSLSPAEEPTPEPVLRGDPEDDMFEATGPGDNDLDMSPRAVGARKGAQTRRENAEKLKQQQTETEAPAETVKTPSEVGTFTVTAPDAHIEFTKPTMAQAFLSSSPIADREDRFFRTGADEPDGAIERALKTEAQEYGEVTDRDLYFYRVGIAEGMRHGVSSRFVTKPT